MNKFGKKNLILFSFAGALFYALLFAPVLRSGYMYDDLHNYVSKGYVLSQGVTFWEMTKYFMLYWLNDKGRTFLFGWYAYKMFSLIDLQTYKVLIVAMTFLNGLFMSYMVYGLSGRKNLAAGTFFFFPVLVSLDCSYFNAMYGFHMLLQVTMTWSLGGILCFIQSLKRNRTFWQTLSCVFMLLSLGTYEVAYVLCPIYFLISLADRRKLIPAVKGILPQICVALIWFSYTVYKLVNAPLHYAGTTIGINWNVLFGFLKQLSGETCVVNCIRNLEWIEAMFQSLLRYKWRYLLVCAAGCLVSFVLIRMTAKQEQDSSGSNGSKSAEIRQMPDWLLWLIGLCMIIGPTFLIAISARYQVEVNWGRGYLPAYVSCWGFSLLTALCLSSIMEGKHDHLLIRALALSLALICLILPNQMIADASVDEDGNKSYLSDQMFRSAREAGLFDDMTAESVILDRGTFVGDPAVHFSYLFDQNTRAVSLSSVIQEGPGSEICEDAKTSGNYWYYTMEQDRTCIILAKVEDIRTDPEDKVHVMASDLRVYVPNDYAYSKIIFNPEEEDEMIIELTADALVNKTEYGKTYCVHSDPGLTMNQPIALE